VFQQFSNYTAQTKLPNKYIFVCGLIPGQPD